MLKFFLDHAGRKMSVVARVVLVLGLVVTLCILALGGYLAFAVDNGVKLLPEILFTSLMFLVMTYLSAIYLQNLACMADADCREYNGHLRVFVGNAPEKLQRTAKWLLVLCVINCGLLLLNGVLGLLLFRMPVLTLLFSLLGAVLMLVSGWVNVLILQAMACTGGAMRSSAFLLRNEDVRVRWIAVCVLIVTIVGAVVGFIAFVVAAMLTRLWELIPVGIVSCVLLLLMGWLYALWLQALGDASEGMINVPVRFFRPLLNNANRKLGVLTAVYMVIVLIGSTLVMLGGVAVLCTNTEYWSVAVLLIVGGLLAALLSWVYALQIQCLADVDIVHSWRCVCDAVNPIEQMKCSSCGEMQPVCPKCGRLQLLRATTACLKCRTRTRWWCSCGAANTVFRRTCRTCGNTHNN